MFATGTGPPRRCPVVWIIFSGSTSPLMKSVIGVSTKAGHSATLLIPSFSSSWFIDCVQPTTAALVAA